MNILYFHTNTVLSSWTVWNGANIIASLGHTVKDGAIPTDITGAILRQVSTTKFRAVKSKLPTRTDLQQCDHMIVYGPEYIWKWLDELYGQRWYELPQSTIGLFLESTRTSSVRMPIERVVPHYRRCYFPDPVDAKKFCGHEIRPSIDTDRFRPNYEIHKKLGAGFVGSVYPSRYNLIMRLSELLREPLTVGDVHCHDLSGERQDIWTTMYVNNIRQLRIHLALPSNNPMIVSRHYETLACGTFLLSPDKLPAPFEEGVHYQWYDPQQTEITVKQIEYYLDHEDERESIAKAGCRMFHENFSARKFWTDILGPSWH